MLRLAPVLILGALVFGLGFVSGTVKGDAAAAVLLPTNNESIVTSTIDFAPFWKAWVVLKDKYVPATTTAQATDQEKIWASIQGFTDALGDPYTVFFPPVESEIFETNIRGTFAGVGMEVGIRDNILTIIAPLKGTPAERAGVLAGDMILKIDDAIAADFSIDDAVKLIRGDRGTVVRLTVARKGADEPIEISIVRDTINIPTVDTELRDVEITIGEGGEVVKDKVFIISLYNFNANAAHFFRQALREFINSDTNKLIVDLRGNPGGYLEAAVEMTSWFLPIGKPIVREDFGENREEHVIRSKGYNVFNDQLKMSMIVNGGSASASEIFAGALSEHGIATLVGTKTFGKGSVQELVKITPETSLKVTIARWLTPNGVSISHDGIMPDINIEQSDEDREADIDTQLERAIEVLFTGE